MKTEVVFILDRSGSMSGLEDDTIGGFNSTLEKQRKIEGEVLVSTVLFDHESIVIHDRVPIADVKPLTEEEYQVRGNTALLDAMGDAIKHIKNVHKYAREEDRPEKTLFVITTDGMENASRRFGYKEVKKLIEEQQAKGWEFLFLGANIDSVEVAGRMGIRANRAVNYHNDARGTDRKYAAVSNFMASMRRSAPDSAPVGDDWRKEVDEDFASRN
ncbi:MAG: VWA domain-containing protein [Selenomonadaceae bacterium]|nr:VWA domain-containing protein [Selenomonadaceae bacterium]